MAPTTEGPSSSPQNQERKKCRRPRMRMCLLKGCDKWFHPEKASERYCSDECGEAARKWSLWKAQLNYRSTQKGKNKRKEQCLHRRERIKNKKNCESETVHEAARVITTKFFRSLLRPPRLLRDVQPHLQITEATLLLKRVPEGRGTCAGAGTAMEGSRYASRKKAVIATLGSASRSSP